MKRNAIIYPYNYLAAPLARYRHLIDAYNIIGLVSPPALALDGHDASKADFGQTIGIQITEDFERALLNCDTVIICEYPVNPDDEFFRIIVNKIMLAMNQGKNVCCLMTLDDYMARFFQFYAESCHVTFKSVNYEKVKIESYLHEPQKQNITPILGIFGVSENCSKFELQLALRQKFLQLGYRVTQIGTKPYSGLFGFHPFPAFMFGNYLEADKVYAFHQYICELEEKENPDLIILAVPGGIIKDETDSAKDFNGLPFEVINAIQIDYLALAVMENEVENRIYDKLCNILLYKYDTPIDAYCVSNIRINSESVLNLGTDTIYDILPLNCLSDISKDKVDFPFYLIHDGADILQVVSELEDKLTTNTEIHS